MFSNRENQVPIKELAGMKQEPNEVLPTGNAPVNYGAKFVPETEEVIPEVVEVPTPEEDKVFEEETGSEFVVVDTKGGLKLRLRSEPTNKGAVVALLVDGTKLKAVGEADGLWRMVSLADDSRVTGYVSSVFVKPC